GLLHAAPHPGAAALRLPLRPPPHGTGRALRRAARVPRAADGALLSEGGILSPRVDVVIVGSGAAGAALTWRLASHGASALCLEQGDWLRPGDFASERHDCEASLRRGKYALLPGDRRRPEDYPVTTAGDGPSAIVMWNGVGGSTVHWEG